MKTILTKQSFMTRLFLKLQGLDIRGKLQVNMKVIPPIALKNYADM